MMCNQIKEVSSGFRDISLAYLRFTDLADLTFFFRELQFLASTPTSAYIPDILVGVNYLFF